jgi:hypothetical protein
MCSSSTLKVVVSDPTVCAYSDFQSAGPDPIMQPGADERHAVSISQTGSVVVYAASYENIDNDLPRPQYGWDITQPHMYVLNRTTGNVKLLRANSTAGLNRNTYPIRAMSLSGNGEYLLWKTNVCQIWPILSAAALLTILKIFLGGQHQLLIS